VTQWVYFFDDVTAPDKYVLGGKGANLADMMKAGLPVPMGFTLPTQACHTFAANGDRLNRAMEASVDEAISKLEMKTGKQFGGLTNPLLVSVRSGAPISMPGMMDTVLNLGLNNETVVGLAKRTGNERFAWDCYRRFIQMFSNVVLGLEMYRFDQILDDVKAEAQQVEDQALTADHWRHVVQSYLAFVQHAKGKQFPLDPKEQLHLAIGAVFSSWGNHRAQVYRKVHKISDELGTAVNVQSMVFGNMGNDSGTGVAFTRNPSTGAPGVFGEYLMNAQGEDVVAGTRTPQPIAQLENDLPQVYEQFLGLCRHLEDHFKDVQDIEFTVEQGRLFLLQTRTAKRTAEAAVKIAVDLVQEGKIDRQAALRRVDPDQLDQLLHPRIDPNANLTVLTRGLPASPGAASGKVVFDADEAERLAQKGHRVLLVRMETTPEDIHGIIAAQGILTSRGGMTSHAAVVARGMGKPCVCGCDALRISIPEKQLRIGESVFSEGDVLSIDGSTGRVLLGEVPRIEPQMSEAFQELLRWADEYKALGVRANADNPEDAQRARAFGAQGIGLCRTEHMFMAADRVPLVQEMILATNLQERKTALAQLLPLQQSDFYGILKAMDGLPVTIRLLDPPLHEFLPNLEWLIARQASLQVRLEYEPDKAQWLEEAKSVTTLLTKVKALHEVNPMLGHRGCRLGLTFPEIYEMQVQAIFRASSQLIQEGWHPVPEVMIPLVGHVEELRRMRRLVTQVADAVSRETGVEIGYLTGTMIEVPRAALTSQEIAQEADFFSFGTNDLTQTTFGYSRDDAEGKFLHQYVSDKVLAENPFAVLDRDGVGELVKMATDRGRKVKPSLKLGICGEHGGEKHSIQFCHETGLHYVSCSPYRVPIARLAAAHAALQE
jgi:pyruvate, orthophosphate dikinase